MNLLNIALLQISPAGSLEESLKKGSEACKKAKQLGADIALFPEMWSCGYTIPQSEELVRSMAIDADSDFVKHFSRIAREEDMAIGITLLESHDPLPLNSLILFDRHGEKKLHYSKVHTCDFGDERMLCQGDDFYTAYLDTRVGDVCVGAMICYDREFPESARILMLKGAELILVPNACPMEINRLSQLRGRAYENMTAIATCNYPATKEDCNGHSSVFDGVAYLPELEGSRDTCIFEADESEGVYIARLDLDMLRQYRNTEVHGNAYRRPHKYSLLTDTTVNPPFVRTDKRDL